MNDYDKALWLYNAIDNLGKHFIVIFQSEYKTLLKVYEWYLDKHLLEDDNPDFIRLYYSALLRGNNSDKYFIMAMYDYGKDSLVKQILKEYLDEHEQTND